MSEIEVIESADEHWWETRWNAVVKYKGEKYVISVMENPKWGEQELYHYDESQRVNMGDEVSDSEIYEAIIGRLSEEGYLNQDELQKFSSFFEDEDEEE